MLQIGPLKAPDSSSFFPTELGHLKENDIVAVLKFLNTGVMPEGVNETLHSPHPKGLTI